MKGDTGISSTTMSNTEIKLLLLPGLDGTGRFFARLQRCLDDRIDVEVVRYPGDRPLGYRELANYVRAHIGAQPVVLLGESFSGPIAIRLAAELPQHVKGLILAATFITSPWPRWMVKAAATAKPSAVPRGWIDAVLKAVFLANGLPRQLALFADGNKTAAEPVSDGAAKDKAARLDAGDGGYRFVFKWLSHGFDRLLEALGVTQQGGDVAEHDAGLGIVGTCADKLLEALHGISLRSKSWRKIAIIRSSRYKYRPRIAGLLIRWRQAALRTA